MKSNFTGKSVLRLRSFWDWPCSTLHFPKRVEQKGPKMPFILFVLLFVTFPLWFPVVGGFFILVGGCWLIFYPVACTVHMLYVRVRHGKWVKWQLIGPKP